MVDSLFVVGAFNVRKLSPAQDLMQHSRRAGVVDGWCESSKHHADTCWHLRERELGEPRDGCIEQSLSDSPTIIVAFRIEDG